jgi:hypothetical protein
MSSQQTLIASFAANAVIATTTIDCTATALCVNEPKLLVACLSRVDATIMNDV